MDPVSLILFDLGNVIADFSHLEIAAGLAETSSDPRFREPAFFLSSVFASEEAFCSAFDEGKMSPQAFYEEACRRFGLRLSYDDFVRRWNASFKENVRVTGLIERLLTRHRLFLLSNTNVLHYEHLLKNIPVLQKMEEKILSFEVGHRKPSAMIYQAALQRAGVSPQQVLYIDDVEEYISAAGSLGIQGIVFRSAELLEEELVRRGVLN